MHARERERDTFTIIPCSTVSAQSHPESKPEEQAADMDLADIDDEEIDKAWFSSLRHLLYLIKAQLKLKCCVLL